MQTTRLNVLDEMYLHLDREDEPWTVHIEIRVEGHIDADRLRTAVQEAAMKHPLARARLGDVRPTDVGYRWEIAEQITDLDLQEIVCHDPGDLTRARERFLSRAPRLDRPGPFSLLLAHDPGGDVLVLSLHHAAGDGLAALRLMASIARAYGGEEHPAPPVDPLGVRDVLAMSAAGSVTERLARARAALDYLARGVSTPARIEEMKHIVSLRTEGGDGQRRPARIAPKSDCDRPGYGFELMAFGAGCARGDDPALERAPGR